MSLLLIDYYFDCKNVLTIINLENKRTMNIVLSLPIWQYKRLYI